METSRLLCNHKDLLRGNVKSIFQPGEDTIPGGDDAAFFHQQVPGVYRYLGTGNKEKGFDKPYHNPYFDFDESMLAAGAAVQAQGITDFLNA